MCIHPTYPYSSYIIWRPIYRSDVCVHPIYAYMCASYIRTYILHTHIHPVLSDILYVNLNRTLHYTTDLYWHRTYVHLTFDLGILLSMYSDILYSRFLLKTSCGHYRNWVRERKRTRRGKWGGEERERVRGRARQKARARESVCVRESDSESESEIQSERERDRQREIARARARNLVGTFWSCVRSMRKWDRDRESNSDSDSKREKSSRTHTHTHTHIKWER